MEINKLHCENKFTIINNKLILAFISENNSLYLFAFYYSNKINMINSIKKIVNFISIPVILFVPINIRKPPVIDFKNDYNYLK